MSDNMITREEQRRLGYLPERQGAFVPPAPVVHPARLEIMPAHDTRMDVTHPATQHVEMRTSATDRAKGFQLIITPISLVVALLAVLVSLVFENEFLSFASLLIFWLTFAVIYVVGWVITALATPEFVSWYGARRQWNVIEREQAERWEHYRWQAGRHQMEDSLRTERQRHEWLDGILSARWFPAAAAALGIYFAVGLAWLLIRGGL